jgi:hypothetical protein
MSSFAHVESGIVTAIIIASQSFIDVLPAPAEWFECPVGVAIGWSFDGTTFTDENGNPPPDPVEIIKLRYILSGAEWVERFTDQEWAWLKVQRVANDRLDQMMDAIRWTNSIDISSPNIDEFYNWMLNNGIPGGQARIDELRAGI